MSGGFDAAAIGPHSVIVGGVQVATNGSHCVAAGRNTNLVAGTAAVAISGFENDTLAGSSFTTVIGGRGNRAQGVASTASGGLDRSATADHSWVGGVFTEPD